MTGVPIKDVHDRLAGGEGPAASTTLSNPAGWFVNWATGNPGGECGPVVNEITAINYLAVYSCVSLIAGTIAALPLIVYRRLPKRGRERATERPEYRLLRDEFNPRMSALTAREASNAHLLTWGNSYAQIVRNKAGKVLQLNPLGPDVVKVVAEAGAVRYEVYQRGTGDLIATLPAADVLHVPGLGFDGLVGYSPVRIARHAIRAGMAADAEADRFISNGIRPPGAIKFPPGKKFATQQQAIDYRDRFRAIHATRESSLNALILEDGSEWQQLGIDPESAQLLESRKFTRAEIAGLYRVPPHMIGDVDRSTSWGTGIESQADGFVKFTLLTWLQRIEQEYNRKLFGGSEEFYCEHLVEGLLRADIAARTVALNTQLLAGVISPNEWRELENRNPQPGGDVYFFPLNVGRVDENGEDIPPPQPEAPAAPPGPPTPARSEFLQARAAYEDALAEKLRKAFLAAVARCLRKEAAEAKNAAKRPDKFAAWVADFYGRHAAMVADHVGPVAEAWSAAFGDDLSDYPARHVALSKHDLGTALADYAEDLAAVVGQITDGWLGGRLDLIAAQLQPPGADRAD